MNELILADGGLVIKAARGVARIMMRYEEERI
jgi:hypothetical protein